MSYDLQPLTSQSADVQRGMTVTLEPGSGHGLKRIFEFNASCVRGQLLGITLGLCEEGRVCCHPPGCPHEGAPFRLPAVRAHLEWGLGGATFLAQADFLNGTVLAVVAEGVKVCAEYIIWGNECGGDCSWLPTYRVSAGTGYVARSSNSNPSRLTEYVTVPAGQKANIAIPNFAISLTAQVIDPAPIVTHLAVSGPCGPRVLYNVFSPLGNVGQHNVENALPIFNGATFVEVDNSAGAAPLSLFLIFGLAL